MTVSIELTQTLEGLFGIPADEATGEAELEADLALDSLAVVELQVALEDRLGVRLRTDAEHPVHTLGDVQRIVDDALQRGEPALSTLEPGVLG